MINNTMKQYLDNITKEMDGVSIPVTKEELELISLFEQENERYIEDRCWFEEELQRQQEREQWEIQRKKK